MSTLLIFVAISSGPPKRTEGLQMACFLVLYRQHHHRQALPATNRTGELWKRPGAAAFFSSRAMYSSEEHEVWHSLSITLSHFCLSHLETIVSDASACCSKASATCHSNIGVQILGLPVSYLEKAFKSLWPSAPL